MNTDTFELIFQLVSRSCLWIITEPIQYIRICMYFESSCMSWSILILIPISFIYFQINTAASTPVISQINTHSEFTQLQNYVFSDVWKLNSNLTQLTLLHCVIVFMYGILHILMCVIGFMYGIELWIKSVIIGSWSNTGNEYDQIMNNVQMYTCIYFHIDLITIS